MKTKGDQWQKIAAITGIIVLFVSVATNIVLLGMYMNKVDTTVKNVNTLQEDYKNHIMHHITLEEKLGGVISNTEMANKNVSDLINKLDKFLDKQ